MSGTYVERKISLTISLGKGSFGESGQNTVTAKGLRTSVTIDRSGLPGFNTAAIQVYGLPLSIMNQVSTLGMPLPSVRNNTVSVSAGDAVSGMAVVFQGLIQAAWADFNAAPAVVFNIQAHTAGLEAMKPIPPSSFQGQADAATIISGLATQMGWQFENNGVSVILSNPYFPGTGREQVKRCAQAANIDAFFDDETMTVVINPRGGKRGGSIPLISPTSGMVGYPQYTGSGMALRCIYNKNIKFKGQVKVQSSIAPACGVWVVNKIVHSLAALTPDGPWFTDLQAYRFAAQPTLPT